MDFIFQLLSRSAAGLIPMLPGLIIYLLVLQKKGKKQSVVQTVGVIIFSYLLTGMLTVTGISSITRFEPRFNLVPFIDIIPDFMQSMLNVVLFVPFGFLISALYKKYDKCNHVIMAGFLFSLSIEMMQMFGFGASDVNDLITNTFGAFLGYLAWKLVKAIRKKDTYFNRNSKELWGLILYAWIVMITVQPWIVEYIFKLN